MLDNSLTKIDLLVILKIPEKASNYAELRIIGEKERNEIDGSEGAIITLWLICEYVQLERRPFVMIS
ncbi:MAG: hypothetical protein ABJ387_06900 [Balneola sp.]